MVARLRDRVHTCANHSLVIRTDAKTHIKWSRLDQNCIGKRLHSNIAH